MKLSNCPLCNSNELIEDWDAVTTIFGNDHQNGDITCLHCGFYMGKQFINSKTSDDLKSIWNGLRINK